MKRRITFFFFLSFTIILLLTCFYYINHSNFFKLKDINISYTSLHFKKQLYWIDRLNTLQQRWISLKGKNIWTISISKIKKELSEEKWIKDFQIQRKWPDGLNISLTPKKILAIEVDNQAFAMPLSETGDSLEASPLTRSFIAPILRYSNQNISQNNAEIRTKLAQVLSHLPDHGYLSLSQIDEITVEQNQIYLHILKEKIKIQLGEEHLPIKIARVEKVLEYLKSQNITNRVIDAHLSQKVLVRPYKHR